MFHDHVSCLSIVCFICPDLDVFLSCVPLTGCISGGKGRLDRKGRSPLDVWGDQASAAEGPHERVLGSKRPGGR